ncbi:MAG TPA: YIP1 family protein, partial [Thermoanaerobaculia bacterium]|nr:YIP1 family protein [Thermoanaerobaculia bacterium]
MESSSFERLFGVLASPVNTFRSIAERPTWLIAFLVVSLLPVVPGILALPKMDWEGITKAQLEQMDVQLSREQMEQRVAITEKVGPIFTYVSPIFVAIGVLLFALIFWGAFTLAGGELGFKRSLAVTAHGMMPLAVASLLAVPIVLSMDKIGAEVARQGSTLKSSLAALAPEGANPVLVSFLSKIDVFTIWSLVLFVLG